MRRVSVFSSVVRIAVATAAAVVLNHSSAQAQTLACGVALDKTALTVGVAEANWNINVTAAAACKWTASSDNSWLVVKSTMPTSAAGNGYAKVRAITNTTSATKRTGHFFVNGIVYTVTQGGCGTSCTGSAAFSPEAGRLTADVDRGGAPAVGLLGFCWPMADGRRLLRQKTGTRRRSRRRSGSRWRASTVASRPTGTGASRAPEEEPRTVFVRTTREYRDTRESP